MGLLLMVASLPYCFKTFSIEHLPMATTEQVVAVLALASSYPSYCSMPSGTHCFFELVALVAWIAGPG